MTGLRDARLQKALESAPDADLRPSEPVRRNILAKAHQAVAPAPAAPWWKALWDSAGRRNSPWNAAFATLVIAGFVTVLWFDREVPGPRQETTQAGAPPPAAAPAPAAPAVDPAPASAPAVDLAARAERAPSKDALQARKSAPAPVPQQGGLAQDAAGPAEARRERRADTKPLRDEDTRALAKSTQPPADASKPADVASPSGLAEASPRAEGTAGARALATAPPPAAAPEIAAAAPAAAPMARSAPPAPAAPRAATAQEAPLPSWTDATITVGGREVNIERSQAGRLAALLATIERGPRGQEPLDGPASLKIELSQLGVPADVLEVAGAQVRWTRQRAGQRWSFVAKPEPTQLQALQDEVGRLLGR
jgi:hypothetical protein